MNTQVPARLLLSIVLTTGLFTVPLSGSYAGDQVPPGQPPNGPPPGMPPGMEMAPPPMPKNGSFDKDVPRGTAAPDGIGVTVSRAPTAGAYDKNTLTYVPWEDESEIQPLGVGASLPGDIKVKLADGSDFDLNSAFARQPTVLIYYRGGWCPFCNAHLRDLQQSIPALKQMRYQLLAVSTDTVEALASYEQTSELDYQLLADPGLELATSLGIKFKVVTEYIDHLSSLPPGRAFDLSERNNGYLVTPAAFILDQNGVVQFAYANNNYAVRISQEALLKAAESALTGS